MKIFCGDILNQEKCLLLIAALVTTNYSFRAVNRIGCPEVAAQYFDTDENMKWLSNLFKQRAANSKSGNKVRVYDMKTRKVTEVPASQLTSNMVQAQIQGIDGVYWVDARDLNPGERRAESFPEEIRDLFRDLKFKLDEVYPMSVEQWEDGFLRDTHPEQEIALWLHVADIYSRFTSEGNLSLRQKREYFRVLATCMNSSREMVLQLCGLKLLATEEAEKVIAAYFVEKN